MQWLAELLASATETAVHPVRKGGTDGQGKGQGKGQGRVRAREREREQEEERGEFRDASVASVALATLASVPSPGVAAPVHNVLELVGSDYAMALVCGFLGRVKVRTTAEALHLMRIMPGLRLRGKLCVGHVLGRNLASDVCFHELNLAAGSCFSTVFESLRSNTALQVLRIEHVQLAAALVEELASALHSHGTIRTLHLHDVCLRSSGARAIASALRSAGALRVLDVGCNSLDDGGADAIVEAVIGPKSRLRLRGLYMNDCGVSTASAALLIEQCPTLRALDVSRERCSEPHAGTKRASSSWGCCRDLRQGGHSGLRPVNKHGNLALMGVDTRVPNRLRLARALMGHSELLFLDLQGHTVGDRAFLEPLANALRDKHCALRELGLRDTGLDEGGLRFLQLVLLNNRSLRLVDIGANSAIDAALAKRWRATMRRQNRMAHIAV